MTGPLGAFYEFVWINPYVPGLSPTSGPIAAYDPVRGRVFARDSWDDGARWLGWFDGKLLMRENGQQRQVQPGKNPEPFALPDFAIVLGGMEGKTEVTIQKGNQPFGARIWLVGLTPGMQYPIKVAKADFEMYQADAGGVIELRSDPDSKKASIKYEEKIRLQLRAGTMPPKGPAPTLGGKR